MEARLPDDEDRIAAPSSAPSSAPYGEVGSVLVESWCALDVLRGATHVDHGHLEGDPDHPSPTFGGSLEHLAPEARAPALLVIIAGAPWSLPHFPPDRDPRAVYRHIAAAFELLATMMGVTLTHLTGNPLRDLTSAEASAYGSRALTAALPRVPDPPGPVAADLGGIFATMADSAGALLARVCDDPAVARLTAAALGRGDVPFPGPDALLTSRHDTPAGEMGALFVLGLLIEYGLGVLYRPDDPYDYLNELLIDVLFRDGDEELA